MTRTHLSVLVLAAALIFGSLPSTTMASSSGGNASVATASTSKKALKRSRQARKRSRQALKRSRQALKRSRQALKRKNPGFVLALESSPAVISNGTTSNQVIPLQITAPVTLAAPLEVGEELAPLEVAEEIQESPVVPSTALLSDSVFTTEEAPEFTLVVTPISHTTGRPRSSGTPIVGPVAPTDQPVISRP